MSGMNYYREVYQYMQCNELFYMLLNFFDIVNEKKCEWVCKLCYNVCTTMNMIQCDYVKSGITGMFIKPKNV